MFNSMSSLPFIPYKILEYLAKSPEAENLWKMIAYADYDALSRPALTFEEKLKYMWKVGKQDKFSVFLTNLVEDGIAESKCILKIYDYLVQPKNPYQSAVVYAFDFLYGGQMSLVSYEGMPVSRGDLFVNIILKVLNGAYVGGVGTLILDDDLSRYAGAKSVIGNSKTFTGVCLYIGTMVGDSGKGINCED